MANLVSPGYKRNKLVNDILAPVEERTIEFKGLNRKPVAEDGEMSDMLNLTSDNYPLLTPRKPRGIYTLPAGVLYPMQIMERYERIAMIAQDSNNNIHFYFDGVKKSEVAAVKALSTSTRMVAINTKICFFPEKTYIECVNSGGSITLQNAGKLDESVNLAPATGTYNVTITNDNATLSIGAENGFGVDDAINLNGTLTYTDSNNTSKTATCVVSCIIEAVTQSPYDIILPRETFIELTGEGATNIAFTGKVERTMPDLDHIIEWNNRLWGASNNDNTIYACKLGDPKNWQYFQGTSLDSYYAQQGSDGFWTGCAAYSNHLIFFKQNSMTRIYGSSPATFQTSFVKCYGVEEGSRRSVVTLNDKVFYKSVMGIMAYEGGIPYCISEKFNMRFKNVVAGTDGMKLYACIQKEAGGRDLMVLDVDKAMWHKEDANRVEACCNIDNRMYYINYEKDVLVCSDDLVNSDWLLVSADDTEEGMISITNPAHPAEEYSDYEWNAVFGPFDEYLENRKIYSKLMLRLVPAEDAKVWVYISIDEGDWEQVYEFDPAKKGGEFIPIIPRRCDRYSIKISGRGNCSIKSLTRTVRIGTGGRL